MHVTSRARAIASVRGPVGTRVPALVRAVLVISLGALGCGAEPVEARAVWVDDFGGAGQRRIHVYDRGAVSEFEVLGANEPVERVRLDPRGRGVLVRSGDRRGAWFDLDDGRRVALLLPLAGFGGQSPVDWADEGLTWIDEHGAVSVVPLAPGVVSTDANGVAIPLRRGEDFNWILAAPRAPILFAAQIGAGLDAGSASFLRYPSSPNDGQTLALEGVASGLTLPTAVVENHQCNTALGCSVTVAVEARGELAVWGPVEGPWQWMDRRAPASAGPFELGAELGAVQSGPGLRLLAVLDRAVSIWISAGRLHHYDRQRGQVQELPLFATPPLYWTTAAEGRALILSSSSGPVYRAELTGIRAVSLETTICPGPGAPVVAPSGRWVAWTCIDIDETNTATGSVVVRVSSDGLERFVGVPMATLAIDDDGDLLLYSVESSFADEVDGVGATVLPRNLFSLAHDGVLTRVDELEPAPTPVLVTAGELAGYIQGAALD